jgi:hypothetical protein
MITKAALAAALLIGSLGLASGPATAAPTTPRVEFATTDIVKVGNRWDRPRHRYYRPRYRHRHYRPYYYKPFYYHSYRRCYTRYVIRYTYWGPQWVPVRSCYW